MKAALFLLCLSLFLAAAPRAPFVGAAETEIATARALAERGSPDLAEDGPGSRSPFTTIHHGRRFALTGPLAALVLLPAELGSIGASRAAPRLDWRRIAQMLESATAAFLAALVCVLFFGDLERLGARRGWAVGATLLLAGATGLFISARVPDGSALAALLLLLSVRGARGDSIGAGFGAGFAAGALALVDAAYLPAAIVLAMGAALRRRSLGRAFAIFVPLAAGVALLFAHRALLGAPLAPPGDFVDGIYGLTISTGKSVFLYTPPLALALFALPWWFKRRRFDAVLLGAVALALLVAVGASPRWHGDPTWGPSRLFLLVPLLLEPVALWLAELHARGRVRGWLRVALLAVAVNGVVVQLLGAALPPKSYLDIVDKVRVATGAPGWFAEPRSECHFIPQFSPLTGQVWLLSHLMRGDRDLGHDAPWTLLQENNPKLSVEAARLRIDWAPLGWPRAQAALWLGLLALLALGSGWLTARRLRAPRVVR